MKTNLSLTVKINIISLIILILSHLLNAASQPAVELSEVYEIPLSSSLEETYTRLLPAGFVVPDDLPAKIDDPLLLTAWVYLYNHSEPITIHNGQTVSGRELAEYARTQRIPILWSSEDICRNNSCSIRPACKDATCVAKFKNKKTITIYLSPRYQEESVEMLPNLAGSLAHELYHHQLPFGPMKTSLYEEYWAYFIGGSISKASWATFDGYNPLQAACLKQWFSDHNWKGLSDHDLYPFTLEGVTVDLSNPTCN
jgi:hypothetical protein